MFKKIFISTLTILLIVSFVSCGNKSTNTSKKKSGTVKILESGYNINSDDSGDTYAHCGAVVTNTDSKQIFEFYKVKATAYDNSGSVIATKEQVMAKISPKEKQGVFILLDCKGKKPKKIEFRVNEGEKTSEDNYVNSSKFKTSDINFHTDEYQGTSITGQVKNTSNKNISNAMLTIILKKKGKIVGADNTFVENVDKKAKTPFDYNLMMSPTPVYDKYEIYVMDWDMN